MGLGYGPITPASSEVLARTTPPDRMALTFSIKQTGVPAGAALAGAAAAGARRSLVGWRGAFLAVAALGVVVVAAAEPTRATRSTCAIRTARRFRWRPSSRPLQPDLRARRDLLELSLAGFAFAAVQVCLSSFLVVYLTDGARAGRWSPLG